MFYQNINDSGASWESKAVWDPQARRTIVTGLEEYRDYNLTVTAFTRIGDGVSCPFLVTRTDEHGELSQTCSKVGIKLDVILGVSGADSCDGVNILQA